MGDKSTEPRKCKLFVGNLPSDVSNEDLEKVFGEIGPIKQCFVVKDKRIGFVAFAQREDAQAAIEKIKTLHGKKLNLSFAQDRMSRKLSNDDKNVIKKPDSKAVNKSKKKYTSANIESKIKQKGKSGLAKGRMVVRNLAFKATEKDIRKAFEKYGNVKEVNLPKQQNGYAKGFCFVQMENQQDSTTAIEGVNGQDILGRPVAVDWAISRNLYKIMKVQEDVSKDDDAEVDENTSDEDDDAEDNKSMSKDDEDEDDDSEEIESMGEDASSDDDDKSDLEASSREVGSKKRKKPRNSERYSDIKEGKTLFVRNISFDTTQEQLTEAFSKFGKLAYAIICIDPVTEHSRGSGFVKFANKESAEECLNKSVMQTEDGGIFLDGHKLLVSIALSKDDTKKIDEDKAKKKKDNRNLYLAREGLIRPGTLAAEGVSKQDMEKRMNLEERKRRMLGNLHMFISDNRLSVSNIPLSMSEKTLRGIFMKAAGPGARLTEVKIMRSNTKFDASGIGQSKGFGFIKFESSEHALKALRATNNNPDIFTPSSRPIVEFTLENKAALKAKERRLENSRRKNKQILEEQKSVKQSGKRKKTSKKIAPSSDIHTTSSSFVGTKSESLDGAKSKALPSHFGPKIRHKKRPGADAAKALKNTKKIQKRRREEMLIAQVKRKNRKEMPPQKKVKVNEDNFDRLVNNYQKKLTSKNKNENEKSKWFKKR